MSIEYVAYVEAVGPADQIALFKRRMQELVVSPTSLGQSIKVDQAEHVAFSEVTSGPALNLAHQPPETFHYAFDCIEDPAFSDTTFRAVLITETLNVEEYVLKDGKALYSLRTREEPGGQPGQARGIPNMVHSCEGDPDAWSAACLRYGVMRAIPHS